jgi:hypothetical protein
MVCDDAECSASLRIDKVERFKPLLEIALVRRSSLQIAVAPNPSEIPMRFLLSFSASIVALASAAFAQTAEQVKTDILSALSTPLPITVIGPVIAQDVKVTPNGQSFDAELVQPSLMGIVPLGAMSFKLTPQGDKLYRVTDFKLPPTIDLMNAATLGIGGSKFDGVWSSETRSYRTLEFELQNVTVEPKGMPGAKVSVGALGLDVAKEGEAGATESKFSLKAASISSQGLPPNNITVANVAAELKANGEVPVDLYSVVSRFAVLTAMQSDSNAVLQFAEGLRAQKYDTVTLDLSADGIEVKGAQPGSNERLTVANVGAVAGLKDVTPDEWGSMTLAVDGKGISDNGISGAAELRADSGSFSLDGTRIPIGATLNALGKLEAASRGETVSYRVSEMLDGLFNMGAITVKSVAEGIAYVPRNEDDPIIRFDRYAQEIGADGFRDNNGRLHFSSAVEGMNVLIKSFPTAMQAKAYGLLNPKLIRYDFNVTELNEQLLRKLMGEMVINTEQDLAGLAVPAITYVMAMKPMIETKDVRFQSSQIDVGMSGKVRFYPAWVLGALPYEGEQKLSFKGYDKVAAYLEELKQTPSDQGGVSDPVGLTVIQSVMSTFKALAVTEGDAMNWTIKYPKAGQALFAVNDVELRFPDFGALMGPIMGYSMMGSMFNPTPAYVPQADAVPEIAPMEPQQ